MERRELALALKGASEIVHNKVYRNMSENAAMYLKEDLDVMGPVRLRDVEEAQMAIIHQALRLEEQGRLIFMSGGDDEYV